MLCTGLEAMPTGPVSAHSPEEGGRPARLPADSVTVWGHAEPERAQTPRPAAAPWGCGLLPESEL